MTDFLHKYVINDPHDLHAEEEDPGNVTLAKAVAMTVLLCASFTIGCLPMMLTRLFKWDSNPKNNIIVQLLLCFGGGVLLCTTFQHVLPEVAENIESLQEDNVIPDLRIHLAETLMCAGFFVMYLVEELVHKYIHYRQHKKDSFSVALRRSLSIRRGEIDKDIKTISTTELIKSMEEAKGTPLDFQEHHHDSHAGHSHMIIESDDSVVMSLRGLLVVLALSVHELFEGLAVGLEETASTVWYMFGAVSAHKLVIAFCIGVELVSIKTRTFLTVIYVMTFAVVSPMGIGIGIIMSEDSSSSTDMASVILQGLASGTLLYVVFFEILSSDRKSGLRQFFSVLVGFSVMYIITAFVGDDEHH